MKKSLIATVVLTVITSSANAAASTPVAPVLTAPGQTAYDASQDAKINTNTAVLGDKVDTSTYTADQQAASAKIQ